VTAERVMARGGWQRVRREYGMVVGHGPGGSRKKFTTSGGPTIKPPEVIPVLGGWLMFGGCVRNFRRPKKTAEN
jgi:hypothetical protein